MILSRVALFFFHWYGVRLDLHSFPTRRSSDLATRAWPSPRRPTRRPRSPHHNPAACAAERSEEHTSELQSPYDLVCRLLLEKKKRSVIPSPTPPPRPAAAQQHRSG